jgi:hypothetical protein
MEEAEVLCDRLGIFIDGSFQCLGNPKEVYLPSWIAEVTLKSLTAMLSAAAKG